MVTIPLYAFLFAYFLFLIIFFTFQLINIMHLVNTGTLTMASFFLTFFILSFSIFVLWGTWYFLQTANWQQPVVIFNNAWFSSAYSAAPSL